jgi:DNA-binding IclR family transcriptional regulator/nitroimidazol reductase NimA-like FMN-containing flavoprotein (pyridoxamine 5'-phosphate oxidase superfamily)
MYPELAVPAAGRTLSLLEFLLSNPRGVTPRQCVDALGISRSTLFDLIQTLKVLGYIEQSHLRGRYRAGPRLLAWKGAGTGDPQELVTAFYQEAASSPLDETLAIMVLSPPHLLILAQHESSQRVRTSFQTGGLLAPAETAATVVLDPSPSETVRGMGFHVKLNPESIELALPICQDGHLPSAALVISAPKYRQTLDGLLGHVDPLRQIAARLSYRLGAPLYAPYQGPELQKFGPTTPLTDDELNGFLQGPWVASLACIRPNGDPHVVTVWHEWDGHDFYVAAWSGSRWADYLAEDGRVSLTIDEPWPPLRRVTASGKATALDDDEISGGTSSLLERLSQRFLGQPLSPSLASRPWRAFRIRPNQVQGMRGLRAEAA